MWNGKGATQVLACPSLAIPRSLVMQVRRQRGYNVAVRTTEHFDIFTDTAAAGVPEVRNIVLLFVSVLNLSANVFGGSCCAGR